ncbi:cation:proton antiporter [Pseudokineococcus basanitobsidens]|uniref:Cation:proton antiporter n=1 Tax=Pseudokineococcus basanitobsidens TaxID=1926649 RepID=A0ABU8RKH8_9ACTN
METAIALAAAGLLAVALAAVVGPRLHVPAPLVLVVLGVVVSVLPFVPVVEVPPELVLSGILPPLLYSTSAAMPAMDLRRELGAVSALSVALVVVSALVLGWVFTLLVPDLPYSWAVALGAVISPTDAVATSIAKQADVSHRVTAILEGESLLNDASALVLLRAAVAGSATAVSLWGVAGQFVLAVAVAVVVGLLVGRASVRVRGRVSDPTAATVISFTVPFAAALPAEALGGSGLVAAVAAGLVVGRRGPRVLRPQQRRSDEENWATVSLVLEGAVFLLMGLEIAGIVSAAGGADVAVRALGLAVVGLLGVVVVRTAVVAPLLGWLHLRSTRWQRARGRVEAMQERLAGGEPLPARGRSSRRRREVDVQRFGRRVRQVLADIDYLAASPLGPREGAVVVWAGMRGAVTVAAAQTLPTGDDGPEQRSLLVLVAFAVAAVSLLVQGGTLSVLIRWLRPAVDDPEVLARERVEVLQLVRDSWAAVPPEAGEPDKQHRLRQLRASRDALLDARDVGVHDADVLGGALAAVDAEEVALDLRGGPQG